MSEIIEDVTGSLRDFADKTGIIYGVAISALAQDGSRFTHYVGFGVDGAIDALECSAAFLDEVGIRGHD